MSQSPRMCIRNGRVIDAISGVDAISDVTVEDGVIGETSSASPHPSDIVIDAEGMLVLPGLVDLHVHLNATRGERGHAMLARAGVTTALDLLGAAEETIQLAHTHGTGLTIASLEGIAPGRHLSRRATAAEIRDALAMILRGGSIGIKLHTDSGWSPDETAHIITEAAAMGMWIAVHCGTTASGSDLTGLEETITLAGSSSIHIAHINSYCRGDIGSPLEEAARAVELLRSAPQMISESYLDAHNGTTGLCQGERPVNPRLAQWLHQAGFPGNRKGIREALHAGWACVAVPHGQFLERVSGAEAIEHFENQNTDVNLLLPVNPADSRVRLATSRNFAGQFDVDALATDGGGFPRNSTLSLGLALAKLGFITLQDLVHKASAVPAQLLGLPDKGRIAPGADGDLIIVDPTTHRVRTTIADGEVVFHEGLARWRPSTLLTTDAAQLMTPSALLDLGSTALYDAKLRGKVTGRGGQSAHSTG